MAEPAGETRCPTCPTCGHPAYVESSDEGTSYYVLTTTDEMCAAAMQAERSQRWHSSELRVWAMLAAALSAASGRTQQ